MRSRWFAFGVGLWLVMAPLVLGHPAVGAVLHDVTLGLLVCVGALATVEWPAARFGLVLPAAWLLTASQTLEWTSRASTNQLACGLAVLAAALAPAGKVAGARSAAKMAA